MSQIRITINHVDEPGKAETETFTAGEVQEWVDNHGTQEDDVTSSLLEMLTDALYAS